jgi:hypothetical protein
VLLLTAPRRRRECQIRPPGRRICLRRSSARPLPLPLLCLSSPSAPRHGGRAGAAAHGDMASSRPSVLTLLAGATSGARARRRGCRGPVPRANGEMREGMGVDCCGRCSLG